MIELLLFGLKQPESKPTQLAKTVIETKIKEPPKIITWQDNPNNCNQETQYIAAEEPFYCIDIPTRISREKTATAPQNSSSSGLNGYYVGQCTGFVASKRHVPAGWGNATDWKYNAINAGWTVSNTPIAGAIAWKYGHVAYVESVNGDTVTISEQNYDWNSGIRTITIPINSYLYIY